MTFLDMILRVQTTKAKLHMRLYQVWQGEGSPHPVERGIWQFLYQIKDQQRNIGGSSCWRLFGARITDVRCCAWFLFFNFHGFWNLNLHPYICPACILLTRPSLHPLWFFWPHSSIPITFCSYLSYKILFMFNACISLSSHSSIAGIFNIIYMPNRCSLPKIVLEIWN